MKPGARRLRSYKDTRGEGELFRRRALAGFGLILLGLCALVGRYVFLQVLHHDEFALRSVNNSVKPRAIPPARGLIYDRNGVLLADNVPAFRLEVIPDHVHGMNRTLAELGRVIALDQDDLDAFRKQLKQSRRFESVPLKMRLTEDDIARFAVNRWRFPGVDVVPYLTRRYTQGPLFAHVVGYVSRIDADDLANLDPDRYKGTTHIGRTGLERSYEDLLHGTPGYELDEVNADGQIQRVLETHPPIPGKNLYLSIDARIQKAAQDAFEGRPGAAVAIDPRNGQVLALSGIAFSAPQPPGSTMKIITATAALQAGIVTLGTTFPVQTASVIDGYTLENANGEACGGTFLNAFAVSCNSVFAPLGAQLGATRLVRVADRFGFNQPPQFAGEAESTIPSAATIGGKLAVGSSAIGQGRVQTTPLEMADAGAAIAIGGRRPIPTLELGRAPRFFRVTSPHVASEVQRMMVAVVEFGTGTAAQIAGVQVAGKTGTAELTDTAAQKPGASSPKNTDAWFVGYAPVGAPRIVAAALFPNQGAGGATAAPAVRDVLEAALHTRY
jgi:penicillin-binding protein 2